MTRIKFIISTLFLLIFSVWSVQGQQDCDFDLDSVIQRVTDECADVAPNQVCYGNRNVTAYPRVRNLDFNFSNPGDTLPLTNLLSLEVDALDATEDTWGVAQMRLQVGSDTGTRDVTMLLFGQFDLTNAVNDNKEVTLIVQAVRLDVYSTPDTNADILEETSSGTALYAVARLNDSSWLRVRTAENGGTVGWIPNDGSFRIDDPEEDTIEELAIHDGTTPYFGAMQAFYFANGNTNTGCNSLQSDGLLIQTPEGDARISLLINEVSIELLSNDSEDGGTAIIQADPNSPQGMSVNVVNGSATVETDEGQQTVQEGQRSSIPISVDFDPNGLLSSIIPDGEPGEPDEFDYSDINIDPLIAGAQASTGSSSSTSSTSSSSSSSSGNGSNSSTSSSSGNGSNSSTSSSSGNGSNSSTGTSTVGEPANQLPGYDTNIVLLWTAVISGAILLAVIIFITIRRNQQEKEE